MLQDQEFEDNYYYYEIVHEVQKADWCGILTLNFTAMQPTPLAACKTADNI